MMGVPFHKYFNLSRLIDETEVNKLPTYFKFRSGDRLNEKESDAMKKALEQPTKEMFGFLGYEIEIKKK
jgi:hypothetical protein